MFGFINRFTMDELRYRIDTHNILYSVIGIPKTEIRQFRFHKFNKKKRFRIFHQY